MSLEEQTHAEVQDGDEEVSVFDARGGRKASSRVIDEALARASRWEEGLLATWKRIREETPFTPTVQASVREYLRRLESGIPNSLNLKRRRSSRVGDPGSPGRRRRAGGHSIR